MACFHFLHHDFRWLFTVCSSLSAGYSIRLECPDRIKLHHTKTDLETSDYVGFTSDPNGRGTPSLLLSCLLTLVLCVWSALHLNVPRQCEGNFSTVLTYLRWITTGVWQPGLAVFTAWRQWCSARALGWMVKEMEENLEAEKRVPPQDRSSPASSLSPTEILVSSDLKQRKNTWTMTHSFFTSTGGSLST